MGAPPEWEPPKSRAALADPSGRVEGCAAATLQERWEEGVSSAAPKFGEGRAVNDAAPYFKGGYFPGPGAHKVMLRIDQEEHALLHYAATQADPAAMADAMHPADDGHGVDSVVFTVGDVLCIPDGERGSYPATEALPDAETRRALATIIAGARAALRLGPAGGRPPAAGKVWADPQYGWRLEYVTVHQPGILKQIRYHTAFRDGPLLAVAIAGPCAMERDLGVSEFGASMGAVFLPRPGAAHIAVNAYLRGAGGLLFIEPRLDKHKLNLGSKQPEQRNREAAAEARKASEAFCATWNSLRPEVRGGLTEAVFAQPCPGSTKEAMLKQAVMQPPQEDHAGGENSDGEASAEERQPAPADLSPNAQQQPGAPADPIERLAALLQQKGEPSLAVSLRKEKTKYFGEEELEFLRMHLGDKIERIQDHVWLRAVRETGPPGRPCLPATEELNAVWPLYKRAQYFADFMPIETEFAWRMVVESDDAIGHMHHLITFVKDKEGKDTSEHRCCTPEEVCDSVLREYGAVSAPHILPTVARLCYRMRDFLHLYQDCKNYAAKRRLDPETLTKVLKDRSLLQITERLYEERRQKIFFLWAKKQLPHLEHYRTNIVGVVGGGHSAGGTRRDRGKGGGGGHHEPAKPAPAAAPHGGGKGGGGKGGSGKGGKMRRGGRNRGKGGKGGKGKGEKRAHPGGGAPPPKEPRKADK